MANSECDDAPPPPYEFGAPAAPEEPAVNTEDQTPAMSRHSQRITDGLEARYRFPEDEPLTSARLNNGVTVTSPVLVEAEIPDHPSIRIRFEVEDGKYIITRFELVRTEGGGAINAAAVRDLSLAPVFKAIRARLVTAFSIIDQLGARATIAPAHAFTSEARPPAEEEAPPPAREAREPSRPRLNVEPANDVDRFVQRPITRPAGRHLASAAPADLDQRRAERAPRVDVPPVVVDGI